ncbi:MAG: NUDIX domain-containing protein [Oscillospiraceae bacterium]
MEIEMNGILRNMASVYLMRGNRVLLLYRIGSRVVDECYVGTAGGHFERNELNDAKACLLRELQEEIGLGESDIENLQLRYITLRLKKDEIRQNYFFFAQLKDTAESLTSNEGKLQWFDLNEAANLEMPHSAKHMYLHYLHTGCLDDKLYGGIATENAVIFTELQEF